MEQGLRARPRRLPLAPLRELGAHRIFIDACRAPEYYLARAERDIAASQAPEIVGQLPGQVALVTVGPASSISLQPLVHALGPRLAGLHAVPAAALDQADGGWSRSYGYLPAALAPRPAGAGPQSLRGSEDARLYLWLGSDAGFVKQRRLPDHLRRLRAAMGPADRLLLGIDLHKDGRALEAAYNDKRGQLARIHRAELERVNTELGADFAPHQFRYRARFEPIGGRVRLELVSRRAQTVWLEDLALEVKLGYCEAIRLGTAQIYAAGDLASMGRVSGLGLEYQWFDARRQYSLNLYAPR